MRKSKFIDLVWKMIVRNQTQVYEFSGWMCWGLLRYSRKHRAQALGNNGALTCSPSSALWESLLCSHRYVPSCLKSLFRAPVPISLYFMIPTTLHRHCLLQEAFPACPGLARSPSVRPWVPMGLNHAHLKRPGRAAGTRSALSKCRKKKPA